MKKKSLLDYYLYIFIIISPLIDILVSYGIRNNNYISYIGSILRGILLVLVFIYLYKHNINKSFLYIFIIYFILASIYSYFTSSNYISDISNIIEIFYLPILILFFNNYKNKNINKRLITYIFLIYTSILYFTYIFGIGHDINEYYPNKHGFLGLFYGGNELSNIILCLLPIAFSDAYDSKSNILKALVFIFGLSSIVLVGTKTLLLGFVIILIYLCFAYAKKHPEFILIFATILSAVVIILPFIPQYKNFREALLFYEINNESRIFNIENIDNLIFSKRLSYASNINKIYVNSSILSKFMGLGRTLIVNNKDIEIDILDIFYSIGIIGTIIYLYMFIKSIKDNKLHGIYKLSFILVLFVSCIAGHALFKPMVSIYIALLFMLSKSSGDTRVKILVVSNMYPNKKYPSYGVFVKNTIDNLIDDGFKVDKIYIYKHDNNIIKLLAYIKLHLLTIIYGLFRDYDFIYVHYISHSSLGAVIVKKLSNNLRIVFNAHGNDVIPDLPSEEKNVIRSHKYLKYAYKVVVPSNYYKNVLHDNYNVDLKKIYVFPSGGINTLLFKHINKDKAKEKINLDTKTNYIGYVSRIDKNKGYDTFIRAINTLKDKRGFKNYKYIIVGSGSEEDKLDSLISRYNLSDYIIRYPLVSQEELVYIYNSLDMFIFPTYRKSDSLGLVGLEAMSCRVPVIAAKNYGPTDYVRDYENGFYFEPENDDDLQKRICEVSKISEKNMVKILDNARKTALRYASSANEDILIEVFK